MDAESVRAVKFSRVFAMPNAETFSIKPIGEFVGRYLVASKVSVDPFARNKTLATYTNDLDPNTTAQSHLDAELFLKELAAPCDLGLFDPPYSPRQISECYKSVGLEVGMKETQNAALYKRVRDAMDPLIVPGGIVLSFGWNSTGMGLKRGYEQIEILLVNHGGGHNDTICVAERKLERPPTAHQARRRMTSPRFAGMGGHHGAHSHTDDWITPKRVIAALGGADSFDLDPCASLTQPWPTARASYTVEDNGLIKPWFGRVWGNFPYSQPLLRRFLARMVAHGRGTAFIFARTETDHFFRYVWDEATAVFWLRGRETFHRPDGSIPRKINRKTGLPGNQPSNCGAPSVLVAYGRDDAEILSLCELDGRFDAMRLPRSVLIAALTPPWREVLAALMGASVGPVRLDELYRAAAGHPKARARRHYRAKLRQELQRGPYRRIERGLWECL